MIIKIDVEGFETNVIAGAAKVLSRDSLLGVIMELGGCGDRYGFDEELVHRKMLDFGFRSYAYSPFKRQLTLLNAKNNMSGNTLYLRSVEKVVERLESAPRFHVHNVDREI